MTHTFEFVALFRGAEYYSAGVLEAPTVDDASDSLAVAGATYWVVTEQEA